MTKKELIQFNSLLHDAPALAIYYVHNGFEEIKKALEFTILRNSGTLTLKELDDIDFDRYRLTARTYEYVVLDNALLHCPNKLKFLNVLYHSLENGAFIIVLEKKSSNNTDEIIQTLDEVNFRVVNAIDIFEEYNLIMAKKLHMWGAGL